MKNKPIIKNNGRYKVLKVAKGVWLGLVNTKLREDDSAGISIEFPYKNIWNILSQKQVL